MDEQLALAEAYMEATSAPEHVVPVLSLSCRRFRTEVTGGPRATSRCSQTEKRGQIEEQGKKGGRWTLHDEKHCVALPSSFNPPSTPF